MKNTCYIYQQENIFLKLVVMKNSTEIGESSNRFGTNRSLTEFIGLFLIYLLPFLTSCIGNISVFVVSHRQREILGLQVYYCCSLAVADLTFTISSLFYAIKTATGDWIFDEFICKLSFYIVNTAHSASVVNLVVLTYRRYKAVVEPLEVTTQHSKKKARRDVISSWIIALIPYSPLWFIYSVGENRYGITDCTQDGNTSSTFQRVYYSFLVLFLYLIPVVLVIAPNFKIYKKLNLVQHNVSSVGRLEKRRKASKVVIIVTTIFFLCWTPFNVMLALVFVIQTSDFPSRHTLFLISAGIVQCQSGLNPIIYFLLSNACKCNSENSCFQSLSCNIRYSVRNIILSPFCCNTSNLDIEEQTKPSGREVFTQSNNIVTLNIRKLIR